MIANKEEMGSRKKLLAPVVVLLLCLVSLTGAAYAYSATLAINGNSAEGDYLSIDLRTGIPADDIERFTDLAVFTDHYVYDGDDKQDLVKSEITSKPILQFKLKIETDVQTNPANSVIVKATGIEALLAKTFVNTDVFGNYAKFYVNNAASLTGAQELATDADELTFAVSNRAEVDIFVYIVALEENGDEADLGDAVERTVRALSDVAAQNDKDAVWFAGQIDASIAFTFEAKYIAPAP